MKDFGALIQDIASLLWPILGFVVVFVFKEEFRNLLDRLRKGKFLGQEIELTESLDKLKRSATAAEEEVASLPVSEGIYVVQEENNSVNDILQEAAQSPKAALLLLSGEIEKESRQLLATVGRLNGRRFVPFSQTFKELSHQFGGLPGHVSSALKFFWEARNRLIHGGGASDQDTLRAIDSGLTILKTIKALPREVNVVHHAGVDIFKDPTCQSKIPNVKGLILETETPGGTKRFFRIFPTTRTDYQKGRRVAWEWNNQRSWGPAWYKDPDTGEIKGAWSESMEFVGRHLDEV